MPPISKFTLDFVYHTRVLFDLSEFDDLAWERQPSLALIIVQWNIPTFEIAIYTRAGILWNGYFPANHEKGLFDQTVFIQTHTVDFSIIPRVTPNGGIKPA